MKHLTFLLLLAFAAPVISADMWKAGAASARITPDKMMWMAGYAGRTKPADGTASDLFAKCTVLQSPDGKRLAMVTLDLIGVPRSMRLSLVDKAKAHGLEAADLVINASHTHCGPELRANRTELTDEPNVRAQEAADYTAALESTILKLIVDSISSLKDARLYYSFGRCGFAMNRRTPDGKGGWNNFPNPLGPVDHQAPVLRVADAAGKDVAIWFGYNCHATTLGFQQYCADWPGFAQTSIQERHPHAVVQFVNGCSGDQNPYPRGQLDLAQTHGLSMAMAVETALQTRMTELPPALATAFEEISLQYSPVPDKAELEKRKSITTGTPQAYAGRLLGLLQQRGSLPQEYPYPVQVIRLGSFLTLVTLGGEVVVDYGLRLKQDIQDGAVWVAGYSNDVMTYIPSLRVLKEGGYEAGGAMQYGTHPAPWSEKVEDHILRTVRSLRQKLN